MRSANRSLTRDIDRWGIAVCPGDVRLGAAPDAPLGGVGSSATPAYAGRVTRMWFPGTESARRSLFRQNFGRIGIRDQIRRPASTIWLWPELFADQTEISRARLIRRPPPPIWLCPDLFADKTEISRARLTRPPRRFALPGCLADGGHTRSLGRTLSERIHRTPHGRSYTGA